MTLTSSCSGTSTWRSHAVTVATDAARSTSSRRRCSALDYAARLVQAGRGDVMRAREPDGEPIRADVRPDVVAPRPPPARARASARDDRRARGGRAPRPVPADARAAGTRSARGVPSKSLKSKPSEAARVGAMSSTGIRPARRPGVMPGPRASSRPRRWWSPVRHWSYGTPHDTDRRRPHRLDRRGAVPFDDEVAEGVARRAFVLLVGEDDVGDRGFAGLHVDELGQPIREPAERVAVAVLGDPTVRLALFEVQADRTAHGVVGLRPTTGGRRATGCPRRSSRVGRAPRAGGARSPPRRTRSRAPRRERCSTRASAARDIHPRWS